MWITRYGKHSFIRTGIRTAARRVREIPVADNRQGLLVPKGFDVASQPPFRRNILDIADGEPHLARLHTGGQCLVCSPAAYAGEDQGAAQYAGVPCTEFVIHEPPVVADSHPKILSRSGTLELLP
jgi:hypothetical protein